MTDPAAPTASLRAQPWYLVVRDEVGEFALANRDVPTSQLDPGRGDRVVADVTDAEVGRYLIALHASYREERSTIDALLGAVGPDDPPSALVDATRRVVLAELRALVDVAFPPGEDVDSAYAFERLLDVIQDRRSALAAGAAPLPPRRPGEDA